MQNLENVLYKDMGWVDVIHISPSDRLSPICGRCSVSRLDQNLFGGLLSGAAVFPLTSKGTADAYRSVAG